jgi:hypothetical protein
MIRVLVMIAVAGFVLCVAMLSAAVAIGGPDLIARGGWSVLSARDWDWDRWGDFDRDGDRRGHHHWRTNRAHGPQASRTLAWSGDDRLSVGVPADIRYIQAPGPGSVTVSGPQGVVDEVQVRDGRIFLEDGPHWWPHKLSIVVRAPNVSEFELSGANALTIEDYNQQRLNLRLSGASEVTASGAAEAIDLDISGTGHADFSGVQAKGAEVRISGAGDATVAPTEWARLDISGMGDIRLLTHPPKLDTNISGAGRIRQVEPRAPATLSPSPSPSPSPPSKGDRT